TECRRVRSEPGNFADLPIPIVRPRKELTHSAVTLRARAGNRIGPTSRECFMAEIVPQKVLIIGAGPVGLTMAIELTRFGIPVQIVEKAAQRTDKSKALV